MFRPSGEAVLLDFGLSHHDQLPDLMQEEFRLPFGTAPYMSPEQAARRPRRSAQRSVCARRAVVFLLDRRAAVRRKRNACAACVAGCGAIRCRRAACGPTTRHGCRKSCCAASRSSRPGAIRPPRNWRFDLSHPDQVKLTARAEKLKRDPFLTVLRRRFNTDLSHSRAEPDVAAQIAVRADHRRRDRSRARTPSRWRMRCAARPHAC